MRVIDSALRTETGKLRYLTPGTLLSALVLMVIDTRSDVKHCVLLKGHNKYKRKKAKTKHKGNLHARKEKQNFLDIHSVISCSFANASEVTIAGSTWHRSSEACQCRSQQTEGSLTSELRVRWRRFLHGKMQKWQ